MNELVRLNFDKNKCLFKVMIKLSKIKKKGGD